MKTRGLKREKIILRMQFRCSCFGFGTKLTPENAAMVALLTIDVAGGETFTCGLVPGSDEASLARAVGARAGVYSGAYVCTLGNARDFLAVCTPVGVDSDGFFLTMGTNRDGVVVPLTTALGSTRLTLHLRPPKSTPPPTPPPSPPPLPGDGSSKTAAPFTHSNCSPLRPMRSSGMDSTDRSSFSSPRFLFPLQLQS